MSVVLGVALGRPASAQDNAPLPSFSDEIDPTAQAGDELGDLYQLLESEFVVTTATKSEVAQAEAPSIITVVPRSVIQARGYRSIADALKAVPGLYVIDDLVASNVGVRGISGGPDSWSRIIKVMIDGQAATFYTLAGNFLGPEFIPMEAVEAIEIIRGPGSALYGANAFLAVVNVITRKPTENLVSASGSGGLVRDRGLYGAQAFANVSGGVGTSKASRLTLAASTWHIDRSGLAAPPSSPLINQYRDMKSRNDIARPVSLFASGDLGLGQAGTLQFLASHQRVDYGAEFAADGILTHGATVGMANTLTRLNHKIGAEIRGGRLLLETHGALNYGGNLASERLDVGLPDSFVERRRSSSAYDVGTEASYAFGPHLGLVGIQYLDVLDRGDTLHDVQLDGSGNVGDKTLRALGRRFRYGNLGTYAQAVIYPIEKLGLTGNVRYDHNEAWDDRVSVRLASAYEVIPHLTAKLLYGTSYVPPSPTQLFAQPVSNRGVQGNPDLKPQTAATIEAALTYTAPELFSVQLNVFRTVVDDRIEYVRISLLQTARNLSQSTTYGGELVGELRMAPFFVQGNASFQHSKVQGPDPLPSFFTLIYGENDGRLPSYPKLQGHLTVGATLPQYHLQATLTAHGAGARRSFFSDPATNLPAGLVAKYMTLDANIRTLELSVGDWGVDVGLLAQNILNTQYAEPGAFGVNIPALGRVLMATLTLSH
ncbi:MAG: TonB-dependent receptor plug domain-containing protein [Myxococcota bacterium]